MLNICNPVRFQAVLTCRLDQICVNEDYAFLARAFKTKDFMLSRQVYFMQMAMRVLRIFHENKAFLYAFWTRLLL